MSITLDQLVQTVCDDLIAGVEEYQGARYIISSLRCANGDGVVAWVEGGKLTDRGKTLFSLQVDDIKLTKSRLEMIDAICSVHGVTKRGEDFLKTLGKDPSRDVREYFHALTRICDLRMHAVTKEPATIEYDLDTLLNRRVLPHRTFERNWCDRRIDPQGAFRVDYRLNGKAQPRHLFHVSSKQKCDRVTGVCGFLKSEGLYAPTLAVVPDDIELGEQYLERLRLSTDALSFGVRGHEQAIIDFALSR